MMRPVRFIRAFARKIGNLKVTGRASPSPNPRLLLVINDVSSRKGDLGLIREFAGAISPKGHRMVGADELRRKVFGHIAGQPKPHLILTGDMGGTKVFAGNDLLRLGEKVGRIHYSNSSSVDWVPLLERQVAGLGRNPRVVVLESDVGGVGYTAAKLAVAKGIILRASKGADVRLVAGAVHNKNIAEWERTHGIKFDYIAHPTGATPIRLTELAQKVGKASVKNGRMIIQIGGVDYAVTDPERAKELLDRMRRAHALR